MKNPPESSHSQQIDINVGLMALFLMLFRTLKIMPRIKNITPIRMANLNIFTGSSIRSNATYQHWMYNARRAEKFAEEEPKKHGGDTTENKQSVSDQKIALYIAH